MKFLSAVSCCMFIAALLLLVGTASAATRTWDGSNSVNWNTAANWVENVVPTTGDDVILTGLGTYRPTNQNINTAPGGGVSINSLTFNSSTTAAFTVSNNRINLTSTGTALTVASGAAAHTISCPMTLGATQTWSQGSASAFTVSGVITDGTATYGITKTGTGTLIFSGTNIYNGVTTISAGTLSLGNGAGGGNIIPAANLITDNAALIYNTSSTITHSGVISGTGTFTKSGTGTLTLSGVNLYTGTTTISRGTLQLGIATATGNIIPATNLIINNAALIYLTPDTITHSGAISGSGTFTKTGTGTLTLSGNNGYTGTTRVSGGTLQLGDGTTTGNIIPAANLITDTAALIYNTPSTITHSGVISGAGGTFTKRGTGTLILSGANSYTGATTVSAGELQFNGVNTGTSAKTVSSGGTLSGSGTIRGAVTVNTGSTLRGGTGSGSTGTLTITSGTGTLTFSGLSSSLNVTSNGASLSLVSVGTNTITENSGMTVNLLDTMPTGTYTLISKTSAGLPATLPTLGTNNSGKIAVFAWVSGRGLTVTLYPVPTVTSVSPKAGPIAGGTTVIITGTGFTGANYTKFGTTANATGAMTVNSDTQITVISPAHAAGIVDITVTNPSGTSATSSADQFTYVVPPTFTSITPNSGTTAGGTAVTIVGTGFVTGALLDVTIGGNAATGVSVTDSTHIAATTPSHAAGAVWVNITNGNGGTVNTTGAYTYVVPSVDITLNEGSITLGLAAGSSATDSSLVITTTANVPFAITVADSSGRSTYQGYMGSYTGSAYDSGGPDLASPLGLAGTTNGTTTAQTITPPILSTAQTLYSGSAPVTSQNLPTLFTQPAVFSDPHLTGSSSYRIDLSFIIQTV